MPIEPPRLRMMLKIAEAWPWSRVGCEPAASADSGVIMNGWPAARTSCDQRNSSIPQSCVRYEFIKQLAANRTRPNPTISRGSIRRIAIGTNGKITNCGRPSHMITSPICSAL